MALQLTGNTSFGSPLLSLSQGSSTLSVWGPFGETAQGSALPGFNGERTDSLSGVSHLGNGYRAYSSTLRRFTCPDRESPFGFGGINPYVYCISDPINATDHSGHAPDIRHLRRMFEKGDGMPTGVAENNAGMATKRGVNGSTKALIGTVDKRTQQTMTWSKASAADAVVQTGPDRASLKGLKEPDKLSQNYAPAAAEPDVTSGAGSHLQLYRGDSRAPEEIKKTGGFFAKSQKGGEQIKQEYYEKLREGADNVARGHIAFKNSDFVSAAVNEQCGGYSDGFIYKMEIPSFTEQLFNEATLGAGARSIKKGKLFPSLLIDGRNYQESSNIAIFQPAQSESREVTFLTPIPGRYITHWRKGDNPIWHNFW